jgi:hypothetical protein
MGDKYSELRINIKFLFKLGEKKTNKIFEMLQQVYQEEIMPKACVSEWC